MKRTLTLTMAVTAALVLTAGSSDATERSGSLHVTKECSVYRFAAGDFCTITSSNINAITAGMRVVYSSPANLFLGVLDSDLVIDGPGNNDAFGHVVLHLSSLSGVVTVSGGTGRFRRFHAAVAVTCPAFPECSWDGTYRFTP
ncbi:MAG TPA: hypothetical protein VID47_00255 [Actinomycetota bacterium]|jgi:hypothetical protein